MICRRQYLDRILPFVDKPIIKVIIGVRRSGKTVLLSQIASVVGQRASFEQVVSLNFESYMNRHLLDPDRLYEYIIEKSRAIGGRRLYLFLDEIQEVESWEKVINSLTVDIDCDIYLTGSNSNMLSGELATYIAGRYVHFAVYPFTFAEVKQYYSEDPSLQSLAVGTAVSDEALFEDYLKYGGLPQRFLLDGDGPKRAYIADVFNTIVVKDVITRNKISDVDLLQRLAAFLLDNVGNTFSATSIAKKLRAEGTPTTVSTLLNYISALKDAMIVMTARRYDLNGKEFLSTSEKYFATDLGLRNHVKSSEVVDYNKLYENVVYLEMLSRGYEISVGKMGDREVDFVCVKSGQKMYIQVAYLLADSSVVEREFRPLLKIEDNFPKYVISGDRHDFSANGIIHKNIIDFLLER